MKQRLCIFRLIDSMPLIGGIHLIDSIHLIDEVDSFE